jgi:hypothetical protein
MSAAQLVRFVRVQGCVNSPKHNKSAAISRHLADFVPAQSIRGVDANTDNIAGLNAGRIDSRKGFID